MIRPFREKDTEAVVQVWLKASIQAHSFIGRAYWEGKAEDMRTLYLPLSEVIVDEDPESGELTGFMGLVDGYLAALFVAPEHQGKGIGTRLLKLGKKIRDELELCVYAENRRAVRFYREQGFRLAGERVEEETGHTELLMQYP